MTEPQLRDKFNGLMTMLNKGNIMIADKIRDEVASAIDRARAGIQFRYNTLRLITKVIAVGDVWLMVLGAAMALDLRVPEARDWAERTAKMYGETDYPSPYVRLARALASISSKDKDFLIESARTSFLHDDLRRQILGQFDAVKFVLEQTHYDEFSNGHFFRRS
jgi:hypothetical protein